MSSLAGHVVLITGGSRGIGAAVARATAKEGARVAFCYRSAHDRARQVRAELESLGTESRHYQADVSDRNQVEDLIAHVERDFGRIDGLVNNAGIMPTGPSLTVDEETWHRTLDTNLAGAFYCTQAAAQGMIARGNGSVVMISSRLAHVGHAQTAAYCASKAGLIGLTRALAKEFASRGVRVNAVAPGVVNTELSAHSLATDAGVREMSEFPLGRFAEPYEIAASVLFLLSAESSPYTGQTLNPNMGSYLQ